LRDEARRGVGRALPAPVTGSDLRGDAVAFAINNAKAAGIGHLLRFSKRDLRDFEPPSGPPGVLVCNPPYGERLGEERELRGLYRLLGEVFAQKCRGWLAFVFTGNKALADTIGLRPAAEVPLYNGKIPCRLLRFEPT
jgi:putative N6-adenine-specific DNA methylase